jgi:hypothetical protein
MVVSFGQGMSLTPTLNIRYPCRCRARNGLDDSAIGNGD